MQVPGRLESGWIDILGDFLSSGRGWKPYERSELDGVGAGFRTVDSPEPRSNFV